MGPNIFPSFKMPPWPAAVLVSQGKARLEAGACYLAADDELVHRAAERHNFAVFP